MTVRPRPTWVTKSLLSARCLSVSDQDEAGSPWLRRGTQLRVLPSAAIGYPICPFTVWAAGSALRSGTLLGGAGTYTPSGFGDDAITVGAWAANGSITVIDQAGRAVERCSRPNPITGFVPPATLRFDGSGDLTAWIYRDGLAIDDQNGSPVLPDWLTVPPIDAIGTPLPRGAWWSGIDPAFPSADLGQRMSGVPDTALPYDTSGSAMDRATALAQGLQPIVDDTWSQPETATPPSAAQFVQALPGDAGAVAHVDVNVALFGASADVASARYWGFGTTLRTDALINEDVATCFAVAALFVFADTGHNELAIKLAEAAQGDPMADAFTQQLYSAHASMDLQRVVDDLTAAGRKVGCLWTVAMASPPPDVPAVPVLNGGATNTRWNQDGTWTAALALDGTTTGAIAATRSPDVVLNELVQPDLPWHRPLVAPRVDPSSVAVSVTDRAVPAGDAEWSIACADLWGQWSPPATVALSEPDMPPMPRPGVTLELDPASVAAGNAPASPGAVAIVATMPAPAAGAAAIVGLSAALVGAASPVPLTPDPADPGRWTATAPVDASTPGAHVEVHCTVTATDAAGRAATAAATLTVYDPRPYVAPHTSGVLLFAGERSPDGFVDLDLHAPADPAPPAGVSWRVYVTDEQLLQPPAAATEPRWMRANRLRATLNAQVSRAHLARMDADVSDAGRTLRLRSRLPGRLESVQGLQIVPVTASGIEAPAAGGGCVIVAVPLSDTAPAPTVSATSATSPSGCAVTVTVTVAYPGIRPADGTPPMPIARRSGTASTPLQARIRRSAAATAPSAWPVLTTIELAPDHPADPAQGWRWRATYTDQLAVTTPVAARVAYRAEAAWPDEPAWDPAPGTVIIPGDVTTTWRPAQAQPSAWGEASGECVTVVPLPVVTLNPVFTDHGDGTADVTVSVPTAHPSAHPWQLAAVAPARPTTTVTGWGPSLQLDGLDASISTATWLLAVSAPDGTTLPMIRADGTSP